MTNQSEQHGGALARAEQALESLEAAEQMLDEDDIVDIGHFVHDAREELEAALQGADINYLVRDETSTDEEDIHREELHDVAHGMVTTAFIFENEERGLTGFKVPSSKIEWVDFERQEAEQ